MASDDSTDTSTIDRDLEAVLDDERRLLQDSARLERDLHDKHRDVDVTVNSGPVRLQRHHMTGQEVKEAAIGQGVPIDVGFQLFEELGGGREQQIGDRDQVNVHEGTHFTAVAPDDNS